MRRKTLSETLTSQTVRRILLAIVTLLVVIDAVLKVLHHTFGVQSMFGLIRMMNLGREMSFPTWYSSLQLSTAGAILAYVAWQKIGVRDPHRFAWLILAGGFFVMSADETMALHENWGQLVPKGARGGMVGPGWVVVAVPLCLILIAFFWRLLASVSNRTRVGWLASGAIFLGGAVGMEVVQGYLLSRGFVHTPSLTYDILNMIENGGELLGIALFIAEVLRYMENEMWQVKAQAV
jgi:hypothetical protein